MCAAGAKRSRVSRLELVDLHAERDGRQARTWRERFQARPESDVGAETGYPRARSALPPGRGSGRGRGGGGVWFLMVQDRTHRRPLHSELLWENGEEKSDETRDLTN